MDWLDEVKWDAQGLVPVIAQELGTNDVLMFAFMNREALAADRRTRRGGVLEPLARRLWHKGESPATSRRCTSCASIATTTWCC